MAAIVTTVGPSFEKPADCFIENAQTTSNSPAMKREIQAMRPSSCWGLAVPVVLPVAGEVVLLARDPFVLRGNPAFPSTSRTAPRRTQSHRAEYTDLGRAWCADARCRHTRLLCAHTPRDTP